MEVTEERRADVVILAVAGRLDAATSKVLEEAILKRIVEGERKLIVDLSGLDYISSSGLRVFLLAAKKMGPEKGKVLLCSMQEGVRQVFDLAGFSSILSIHNSREEALQAL
jgi:anti-anti-sigma factor